MYGNISKKKLNENEKFAPLSIYALSKASAFFTYVNFIKKYLILKFMVQFFLTTNLKEEQRNM